MVHNQLAMGFVVFVGALALFIFAGAFCLASPCSCVSVLVCNVVGVIFALYCFRNFEMAP